MALKTDILKWSRAFAKAKQNKPPKMDKLSRYTNFTLGGVWEKYDCQTALLCREAMIPLMQHAPSVLTKEVDLMAGKGKPAEKAD